MPLSYAGEFGGLADSKYSGMRGSFAELVGIDGISTPGILKARQKLTKEIDANAPDELCKVSISLSSSADNSFWFSSESGKIWRRTAAGVWVLVHTTTPAAGEAKCLGAAEFDGYLYWATESRLHRIPVGNVGSEAAWTANADEDFGTFARTDASFHPMTVQNQALWIGDARGLAVVDTDGAGTHTFTATSDLLLDKPHRIKAISTLDTDIVIGTFIADNVHRCIVVRWDTESESFQEHDSILENGVHAFMKEPAVSTEQQLFAFIGQTGNIYRYDGAKMHFWKKLPGDWSSTKRAFVNPNATGTYLGQAVFGLSNKAGNPTKQGVYVFGRYSTDYPITFDLSFPISERSGGDFVTSGVEIGNVLVVDDILIVSWSDGTTKAIDVIDEDTKLDGAFLETRVLTPPEARSILKTVKEIFADYVQIPSSCDIGFEYRKAHEASYVAVSGELTDAIKLQKRAELTIDSVASFQLKTVLTTNDNDAPELETLGYRDNLKEK